MVSKNVLYYILLYTINISILLHVFIIYIIYIVFCNFGIILVFFLFFYPLIETMYFVFFKSKSKAKTRFILKKIKIELIGSIIIFFGFDLDSIT